MTRFAGRAFAMARGARLRTRVQPIRSGMRDATLRMRDGNAVATGKANQAHRGSSNATSGSVEQTRVVQGQAGSEQAPIDIGFADNGTLTFTRGGKRLSKREIQELKQIRFDELRELVLARAQAINHALDRLHRLHLSTPPPDLFARFEARRFAKPKPEADLEQPSFLHALFPFLRQELEEANQARLDRHQRELAAWHASREAHADVESERRAAIEERLNLDPDMMRTVLSEHLQVIDWPHETQVNFEVDADAKRVLIDCDLPEIEDIPDRRISVPSNGLHFREKRLRASELRENYALHVHAIVFRLMGEAFAALPTVDQVLISAYSQRLDEALGRTRDQYLLSALVTRSEWALIDFDALESLDLIAFMGGLNLLRKMDRWHRLDEVEPFGTGLSG